MNSNPEDMIVTVFKVYTSKRTDNEKGELVGVWPTFQEAHKAAAGKGGWTQTGIVEPAKAIVIDGIVFLLGGPTPYYFIMGEDIQEKEISNIEAAISKLSEDDIKRLKLDPEKLKKDVKAFENEKEIQ